MVFTNGVFDILHRGHVDYLFRARDLGSRLLVGLNDDASAGRLKGPGRPVHDQAARARVLTALRCVDGVVYFSEDTPLQLILELAPDVLVKGADYRLSEVVGHREVIAAGGRVELIPLTPGHSTTGLVRGMGPEADPP